MNLIDTMRAEQQQRIDAAAEQWFQRGITLGKRRALLCIVRRGTAVATALEDGRVVAQHVSRHLSDALANVLQAVAFEAEPETTWSAESA